MDTSIPVDVVRRDLFPIALGIFLVALGAIAVAVFLYRRRRAAQLYFGVASFLYGARLVLDTATFQIIFPAPRRWAAIVWVITFLIGIPWILFLSEVVMIGWRKLVWWVLAVQLAIAVFGISALVSASDFGAARMANNIFVVLITVLFAVAVLLPGQPVGRELRVLRIGLVVMSAFVVYVNLVGAGFIRGNDNIEPLGFFLFLLTLAYVAASRSIKNDERLLAINKELQIAREIQRSILPQGPPNTSGLAIAARYLPMSDVAGDFYDFVPVSDTGIGILVADVSGHGVPAALSASMVKIAVRAQAQHAANPATVLAGLNNSLYGNMQGQFVTASYLFVDVAARQFAYSGAGHPPMLVWRATTKTVDVVEENGLFLGAFPSCTYIPFGSQYRPGDRFVLYTDGILEAANFHGEEFGRDRLSGVIAAHPHLDADALCDKVIDVVARWSSTRASSQQQDDLTLVIVDVER